MRCQPTPCRVVRQVHYQDKGRKGGMGVEGSLRPPPAVVEHVRQT